VSSEPEINRKSHAFKILTYKMFVMNILRGILTVKNGKSLILDILQDRGERGVGVPKDKLIAQNGPASLKRTWWIREVQKKFLTEN
jgi:hypothetical protein